LLAVLGVHSSKPRLFAEEEVVFLDSVVIVLAHAMCAGGTEEAFHALLDGTPDVVAASTMRCGTSSSTQPSSACSRHQPSADRKRAPGDRRPESLVRSWEISLRRVWQTGREQTTDFRVATPDGERTFQSGIVPGFGSDGSVQFVLAISRDISEQRAAQLERAQLYREVVAQQQQLRDMVADLIKRREQDVTGISSIVQMERLTPNDRHILRLVAKGWTNREIAAELGRSPGAVKNQVARILVKLDVSDRTQSAVHAAEAQR